MPKISILQQSRQNSIGSALNANKGTENCYEKRNRKKERKRGREKEEFLMYSSTVYKEGDEKKKKKTRNGTFLFLSAVPGFVSDKIVLKSSMSRQLSA